MISTLRVLSPEQEQRLHDEAMRILSEIGVAFEYEPAIECFKQHGFQVEGSLVKFTEDQVLQALESAPSSFTMQARNPEYNVKVAEGSFILTPSYGPPFLYDGVTGERRETTYDDYKNVIRLAQMSQNINSSGGNVVEPQDLPDEICHLLMHDAHIKLSDKTCMGSARGAECAKDSCEIAAIMFGGKEAIKKTPALNTLINSITPLKFDERMTGACMTHAEYGQSCMVSSLVMSGSTGPVTLIETMAIQLAETLAGIVLTQLVNPGAPVIMGQTSGLADMKTLALAHGNAETALYAAATCQMAHRYGIPARVGGSNSDGILVDAQAGYEGMMTLFATALSGAAYVLHGAGIMHSYNAFCYEKFIIDDEMAGMIKTFQKGFDCSEERFVFDDVAAVGPGGHFLYQDSTLQFMHDHRRPIISSRDDWEAWDAHRNSVAELARAKWQQQLKDYVAPVMDPGMAEEVNAFITKRCVELVGEAPKLL